MYVEPNINFLTDEKHVPGCSGRFIQRINDINQIKVTKVIFKKLVKRITYLDKR